MGMRGKYYYYHLAPILNKIQECFRSRRGTPTPALALDAVSSLCRDEAS